MALEMPVSVAIVSRLANAEDNTAALLILMAVAIWIESPVIDLLATSTTLVRDSDSYHAIVRFAQLVALGVTVVHALVVLTPIYPLVIVDWMGVPLSVADPARVGLALMVPWSALIGWRRTLQGVMIRNGRTKPIGVGTFLRVATITGVGFLLYATSSLSGIVIVAIALLASVAAESLFIHFVSRETVRKHYGQKEEGGPHLTLKQIARFHFPLTLSTMITITGLPVVGSALARTPDAVLAMAAWQVAGSLVFLPRAITFALLEVVISLLHRPGAVAVLRRFCWSVGLGASGAMLLLGVTGADHWLFVGVLGTEPIISRAAHIAFFACTLLPVISAGMSFYRGRLTAGHQTLSRLSAIGVGTAVLIASLSLGVSMRWPGVWVAAIGLTLSALCELCVLAIAARKLPSQA